MTDSIQITARDDKPSWTKTRSGLTLSVRMGRFALPYHHDEFRARFSERDIRFVINDASGRVVAKGTFEEWRQDSTDQTGIDGFRFALENISNEWAKLSEVIFYNWTGEDEMAEIPFDHGSVLVFERLEIKAASAAESNVAWSLINEIIARRTTGRGTACLMILKAFPLEYEGNKKVEGFERSRGALQRLYRKRLSVQALPDEYHEWMWRRFSPDVPAPALTKREDPAIGAF